MSQSPFYQSSSLERVPELVTGQLVPERTSAKADGPSRSDLERWYETLQTVLLDLDGKIDSRDLEDVRDAIYEHLR